MDHLTAIPGPGRRATAPAASARSVRRRHPSGPPSMCDALMICTGAVELAGPPTASGARTGVPGARTVRNVTPEAGAGGGQW